MHDDSAWLVMIQHGLSWPSANASELASHAEKIHAHHTVATQVRRYMHTTQLLQKCTRSARKTVANTTAQAESVMANSAPERYLRLHHGTTAITQSKRFTVPLSMLEL